MRKALAATVLVLWGGAVQADDLRAVMEPLGCTIGTTEAMEALVVGRQLADRLQDWAVEALAAGQADKQGDWIVLGPEICTIRPPVIESDFALDDPIVLAAVGEKISLPEFQEFGCFFDLDAFLRPLNIVMHDAAFRSYFKLLGKGIIDGRVAFYSDDVLRTPAGPQLLDGACGDVPNREAIDRNHAAFIAHFDALVRWNASVVACGERSSPVSINVAQTLAELSDGQAENKWTMIELVFVAMGAGWIEGVTYTERGTPRPPLCSYDGGS